MMRFLKGNRITLLRCGAEYFPALEEAIDRARRAIYLQTYIYENDEIGRRIGEACKRAAGKGVEVCLLIDGFGSSSLPASFVDELRDARVKVIFYRPRISPFTLKKNRLRRLHAKVVAIDGIVAFVGGINIIDDMNKAGGEAPRIDYAVKVEGPLVRQIFETTRRLWRRLAWLHFRQRVHNPIKAPVNPPIPDGIRAAYVVRDNVSHRRDFEHIYLRAINTAKSEIIIANAYFLPGHRFRQALIAAAERGVKVKLLLQGRMEYMFLFATHAFYDALMDCGIEIYEYQKSYMHSKVAVIDRKWATVGSSNIDPFSFLLAREANVVVSDAGFANQLREDIEHTIEDGGVHINPESWRHERGYKRFVSWIMYEIVRIGLGFIGSPDRH